MQSLGEERAAEERSIVPAARRASTAIIVVLSIWLGAVAYFIAIVAPAAFRVLPTRMLAGALVGQTLPAIFISGIVGGVLVMWFAVRGGPALPWRRLHLWGGFAISALDFVAQFIIARRIEGLLAAMGAAPDALPPGNPMRVAFGRLHGLSVLCLGIAALVGLVLLVVTLMAQRRDFTRRD